MTSTARFALPAPLDSALADLPLGALDGASVRKLWMRGRNAELVGVGPAAWSTLCERFGRNARILDWARQLLGGKLPDEVRKVMADSGLALPVWKDQPLDEDKADDLVAAFLRHMAFDDAANKVGPDAMAFIDRARVYEVPVPIDAFAVLTTGLAVALDRHVPALANLGLLEMGTEEDRVVYRVSPLVKPAFDAPDGTQWHGIAAEYWYKAAKHGHLWNIVRVFQAWEHALAAKRQDIADHSADLLHSWLAERGTFAHSAALGERHKAALPESVAGLNWAGYALSRAGDPRQGQRLLKRAVDLASSNPAEVERLGWVTHNFADVLAALGEYTEAARYFATLADAEEALRPDGRSLGLHLNSLAGVLLSQGDLAGARARIERAIEVQQKVHGTEDHPDVAASLDFLGIVLLAQGEFAGARALVERAMAIDQKVYGTEDHPNVAASFHHLARVLFSQGDLAGARASFERAMVIQQKVYGTEDHPNVATSLSYLAVVLLAQGDLAGARARLERAMVIQQKVHGTEDHPDIASSLYHLALVLFVQGELAGARAHLERSLAVRQKVHGTEVHPAVASSFYCLAVVLHEQGNLEGALALLEHALDIQQKVYGTEVHPDVAYSLDSLATMLLAQGDLAGARARLDWSLKIQHKVHGTEDHPDVAASLCVLAAVLHAQGDLASARARLDWSLKIQHKVYGTENHPVVAMTYHKLGSCLRDLGRFNESERAFRTAQRIRKKVFGTSDHYKYAETELTLAMLIAQRGRPDEARNLFRHAVAVLRKQVPSHPLLAALTARRRGLRRRRRGHLARRARAKQRKIGRNQPCPCGSGKKYKRCCLSTDEAAAVAAREEQRRDAPPPPSYVALPRGVARSTTATSASSAYPTTPSIATPAPWSPGA
ncbi:MAG TPA: tetratricopeptide repeat protein [Kofleriaceae bacterium]|nr:tetratricopeptide repeat protein [Kofleriaceae bacterium]